MNTKPYLAAAGLLLAALSSVSAADPAYMKVVGQRSGQIQGDVTTKGLEGTIEVLQLSHEIISPRDPASGLPTGKRQHKPLQATLTLDRSAPLLINSLITNENLTSVEIDFYRKDAKGFLYKAFTIKLTNASMASVKVVQPDVKDPANAASTQTLDVSFTYEKIEWTWLNGGVTASDDWEQRA